MCQHVTRDKKRSVIQETRKLAKLQVEQQFFSATFRKSKPSESLTPSSPPGWAQSPAYTLVVSFPLDVLLVSVLVMVTLVLGSSLMKWSRPRMERLMLSLKPRPRHT